MVLLGLIALLPLVGATWARRTIPGLFEFPPALRIPHGYPAWSWIAVGLVLLPFVAFALAWTVGGRASRERTMEARSTQVAKHPFPAWGWWAVAWTTGWWVLAWTRWSWFAPLQHYTFFPLWVGLIVAFNALAYRASGSCLMLREPRRWLGLFAASAVFWWMFEWLNRFVLNWHYLAVEHFGPVSYAVHATLCFSTVLPAVAAVAEWLGTCRRVQARLHAGPAWPWLAIHSRAIGAGLIALGAGGLLLTGAFPQEAYPALWGGPLALLLGESLLRRRPGVWQELAVGNWTRGATWALAAVACGFFWEMWNYHSLAKWIYTVPYVDRGHVFEMPVLGYLGYLPFGLECLVVVERLADGATSASAGTKHFVA